MLHWIVFVWFALNRSFQRNLKLYELRTSHVFLSSLAVFDLIDYRRLPLNVC